MANVGEITAMCRAGNISEAYEMAKNDLENTPNNVWAQREVGWALYYRIKQCVEIRDMNIMQESLEELSALDLLTPTDDAMIFDNVIWKIAEYVKDTPKDSFDVMDQLFQILSQFVFSSSERYSYLLRCALDFEEWNQLAEFMEWWNLDLFMNEDFQPYEMQNGRKIMSLAERAYIAYSKQLLQRNDKERINAFLPKIEQLMEDYPEMVYPGYFCGKLMLAMGADTEEALEAVLPFVRKKKSEFWVWQLMSELFRNEPDKQLACLSRAVHCKTQDTFLVKVRTKLAAMLKQREEYGRARYQIDRAIRCYVQQGWNVPHTIQDWIRSPWFQNAVADETDCLDYKRITNQILANGAMSSIAAVTYVDLQGKRAALVYGEKMRTMVRFSDLQIRVKEGMLLNIHWQPAENDRINIISAEPVNEIGNCTYIRRITGTVDKKDGQNFAFVRENRVSYFVSPNLVQKAHLQGGEEVTVLAVLNFNKKKATWDWTCQTLRRKEK